MMGINVHIQKLIMIENYEYFNTNHMYGHAHNNHGQYTHIHTQPPAFVDEFIVKQQSNNSNDRNIETKNVQQSRPHIKV